MEPHAGALGTDAPDNVPQMEHNTENSGLKSLGDDGNNNPKFGTAQDSNFAHVDKVKEEPSPSPPSQTDDLPPKPQLSGHTSRVDRIREGLESAISDEAKSGIETILDDVRQLSDVEKLLLYLKLPTGTRSKDIPTQTPSSSLHLSNLEHAQAFTWIQSHLEEDLETCLRKDEVFDDYRAYCHTNGMKPLNTADFGKVMKRAFPNVKPRRLGQRGQSKYCYSGLRKRLELQPPSLPDLAEGFYDQAVDSQKTHEEELMPECIALICEWAENLLGRGFTNIRDLAEHLLSNLYVNSKSTAAFALTAAMQKTKTSDSKVPVSSLFASKPGGGKHTDTQIQLQRRIQERELIREQKKKIQQQREEIGKGEAAETNQRRKSIKTKLFSPPVGTMSSTQTSSTTSTVTQAGYPPGQMPTDLCDYGGMMPGAKHPMPDPTQLHDWKQLPSCTQNIQGNVVTSSCVEPMTPSSSYSMARCTQLDPSPSSAFMPVAGSPVGKGKPGQTSALEALLNENPMNKMGPMDQSKHVPSSHMPGQLLPPHCIKMEGSMPPMGHMPLGPMRLPNMPIHPGDIRPPLPDGGMIRGPSGNLIPPHPMPHGVVMPPHHQQGQGPGQPKLKFTPIKPKTPSMHGGKTVSEMLKDVRGYGPEVIDNPYFTDMRPVAAILKESRDKMSIPPGMPHPKHSMEMYTPTMKRTRNNSQDDCRGSASKRPMLEGYADHPPSSISGLPPGAGGQKPSAMPGRIPFDDHGMHNIENDALLDYLDAPSDAGNPNQPPPPYPGRPTGAPPGNFVQPQGRAIHRQHSTGRRSPDHSMTNPNMFTSPKPQKMQRNPSMPSSTPIQIPRSVASSIPFPEHLTTVSTAMPPNVGGGYNQKPHGMPQTDDGQFELFLNQSPQRSPARRNFPPLPGDQQNVGQYDLSQPMQARQEPGMQPSPQDQFAQGQTGPTLPVGGNYPQPPQSAHLPFQQQPHMMTASQPSPHSNPSSHSSHSLISPRQDPSPLAPLSSSPPTPSAHSQRSSTSTPPPASPPVSHASQSRAPTQCTSSVKNIKPFVGSNVPTSQKQWNVNIDSQYTGHPATTAMPTSSHSVTFTDVMLQSKGLAPRTPIVPPPPPPVSSFGVHNLTNRISNQLSDMLCMVTRAPQTPGHHHTTFSPAPHGAGCGIWPNLQATYRQITSAVTNQPAQPNVLQVPTSGTGLTPPTAKRNLSEALETSAEGGLNISDDLQSTLDVLRDFDTQYFTQGESDSMGNNSGSKIPPQGLHTGPNPLGGFSPGIAAEFPNIFGHEQSKRGMSENQVVPPEGMALTPESDILCYDNVGVQKLGCTVTTH